mgnify:CR=1 FL=1
MSLVGSAVGARRRPFKDVLVGAGDDGAFLIFS